MTKELPKTDPELTAFDRWLESRGAVRAVATSDFEIRRWHTALGHLILYRNARDERRWIAALGPRELGMVVDAFFKGVSIRLGVVAKSARKAKKRTLKERHMAALLIRQSGKCFYCDCPIEQGKERSVGASLATFEHMVSLVKGGPDSLDNMVAACEPCNQEAGSLSVFEKVILRETRLYHE